MQRGMPTELVTGNIWIIVCHLALLPWSPSSLPIIWFLVQITYLQGEACLLRTTRNFWFHSNYISYSKLLSWHSDFIQQPVESFFIQGISYKSNQLQNTNKICFYILEPKEPDSNSPRYSLSRETPHDQHPTVQHAGWMALRRDTLWLSSRITLEGWVLRRVKRADLELDKFVVKS